MKSSGTGTGAAILAGGASSRMGSNKAFLRLHPGGATLIESVILRLQQAGFGSPLLVTNTPADYALLHLPTVADEVAGAGPLGGVLAALCRSPHEYLLVVGCDMPALNPALLRHMAARQTTADALVPRWTKRDGRIQAETLHAIYSRSCIEPIRRRIAVGEVKMADLLGAISVEYLEEDELRLYDPELAAFRNINTPEEWAEFAKARD
ncbi:MAG: molybdenum cofactor guanylyltransferase [Chloroflexi bacterium]|nr:molybdenum cofactor guanylyltransferase [Chloroflexota bacterium]